MAAAQNPNYSEYVGAMFLLDLNHPELAPVKFSIIGDLDLDAFNPHGISIHTHKGLYINQVDWTE